MPESIADIEEYVEVAAYLKGCRMALALAQLPDHP